MNAIGLQALLLTTDALLASNFSFFSRELGIEAQSSADPENFSQQLSRGRYEALLLDFDTVPGATSALETVRTVSRGRNAVVFAVATSAKHREDAIREGAHFLLQRPIEPSTMRELLNAAYDSMCAERRKYYRCVAELSLLLTPHSSGTTLQCSTFNVSSDGAAVSSPIALTPAETAAFELVLPGGVSVRGTAIVIWGDKQGKSGLKIRCNTHAMRQQLDAWLDEQIGRSRDD